MSQAKRYSRIRPSNDTEQAVLNWANEIRTELKRKPVKTFAKGIPLLTKQCVLARTIGETSIAMGIVVLRSKNGIRTRHIPEIANRFIISFDLGHLPHLQDNSVEHLAVP